MNEVKTIAHAYSQAPWRKQLQIVAYVLLVMVIGALVASVYLYVSSQAVSTALDIQRMQYEIRQMKLAIEDYETQLATLTSEKVMEERAKALGFEPVDKEEIVYLHVEGYIGRQSPVLAPPSTAEVITENTLAPEHEESLIEWLAENLLKPSEFLTELGK